MFVIIRLIRKIMITMVLVLLPAIASAGIYKWIDDNGKVHYTDKPLQKEQGTVPEINIKLPKNSSRKGFLGTRVAAQLTPIRYSGEKPSRRVRLEKMIIDLENDNGGRLIIGYEHSGASCKRDSGGFTWSQGRSVLQGKSKRAAFTQEFKKNNYQIEDIAERLFAEQKNTLPNLVLLL